MQTLDSILDVTAHARIIADMEHVCKTANVNKTYVHRSMQGLVGPKEIDWVRRFNAYRNEGVAGVVFVGTANAETRMMAMCGALIRNFIDARFMPLNTILSLQEKGLMPEPTALFIPNLFLATSAKAGGIPVWKVQVVYDLLLQRFTAGKPTVVFAESLDALGQSYGQVFLDHLKQHYKMIEL
jgi:hypothetical protein